MDYKAVTQLFQPDLEKVEYALRDNYLSDIPIVPGIGDYILSSGGKRIRPMLLLISSRLCGLELNDTIIKHCCVIENVHAATLLHDDVVDETTVRRGRQTVNSKWGNDASILVGDYLIAQSLTLLADNVHPEIFKAFSRAAKYLVEGGLLEFSNARDIQVTEKHCLDVIYRKTASMMSLSCQLGALIAKAETDQEEALIAFGDHFGMAFQIMDDLMDYDAKPESLGKPPGTDFKEGHVTLPLHHLYHHSKNGLRKEIEGFIKNDKLTDKELEYIVDRMRGGQSLEYTYQLARKHMDRAKSAIRSTTFAAPKYKDALLAVADYIISRHTPTQSSLANITRY
ncbi:MAG: polyprenyl synthetase family protein [Nitrospinaceae bacterium]|nr:polyprenyl synthetase family protein [Nitrospinaceae bacterium]NIR57238.1 polyprenyl synthetase family protein [Nitrospinaceae bacterium]NIS87686.1 polyprenyl synthetase family protein [Nitrospinaceae bacterium]NIT84552.1 polyprenyl synthetase family protein [Nitrospinaceae bacterium]NIU46738.1 polyprenyl synthetase family protein [Nitrospinaceae bacterium]